MKIYQIFKEIDNMLSQINGNRKRTRSIKFFIQKIFEMLKIPCNKIMITKSQTTTDFYEQYLNEILL